jgi:hypothetical protein
MIARANALLLERCGESGWAGCSGWPWRLWQVMFFCGFELPFYIIRWLSTKIIYFSLFEDLKSYLT